MKKRASNVRKQAGQSARLTGTSTIPARSAAAPESVSSATDAVYPMRMIMSSSCSPLPAGQTEEDKENPEVGRKSILTILAAAGKQKKGLLMETTFSSISTQKESHLEEPRQSKIIIRRTFGDQSLLEIYADYVAEKVLEEIRKQKEPLSPRS